MITPRLTSAGFTLIETLVAILILSMAIAGPLTIASRGLGAALISKDENVAFYLAQDAVEYVRFKRDSNRLAGLSDQLTGLDGANGCTAANGCTVDSITDVVSACSGVCGRLNYDTTTYRYGYSSGSPSIFTRTVKMTTPVCASAGSPCNSDEAHVDVTVTWNDVSGAQHKVDLVENILNWQ